MDQPEEQRDNQINLQALSEWQLMRVRDALRAYHRYERTHDGCYFTWRDVREAIAVYTEYEIGSSIKNGSEILRQFVEGSPHKDDKNKRKYRVPDSESIKAILQFVTDEELNLLSLDELVVPSTSWPAALRLNSFFEPEKNTVRENKLKSIAGTFITIQHEEKHTFTSEITLEYKEGADFFEARQTLEYFEPNRFDNDEAFHSPIQRKNARVSGNEYFGWVVLTPDDTLLFFFKEPRRGINHHYLTISMDHFIPPPTNGLLLYHHQQTYYCAPHYLPRFFEEYKSKINHEIAKKTWLYYRIEEGIKPW